MPPGKLEQVDVAIIGAGMAEIPHASTWNVAECQIL
jgi:hypothetical protein